MLWRNRGVWRAVIDIGAGGGRSREVGGGRKVEGLPVSITLFIYLSGGVLPISFRLVLYRPSVGCLFVLVFLFFCFFSPSVCYRAVWRNEIICAFLFLFLFSFFSFFSICLLASRWIHLFFFLYHYISMVTTTTIAATSSAATTAPITAYFFASGRASLVMDSHSGDSVGPCWEGESEC